MVEFWIYFKDRAEVELRLDLGCFKRGVQEYTMGFYSRYSMELPFLEMVSLGKVGGDIQVEIGSRQLDKGDWS